MIFYFCPDISKPSGGIKRLYRHVFQLNRLGREAVIVHDKQGFILTWHGYEVPVVWMEDRPVLGGKDVLVFPEGAPGLMKQTKQLGNTRVVIALSWAYIYRNLPVGHTWKDYGICHVLTPSLFVKDFLEWFMEMDVTLIPDYVDPDLFFYDPAAKRLKVSYCSRKNLMGDVLRGIFAEKGGPLSRYEWTAMEDFSEAEYARHLRESRIYLATSPEEGRNVSVLEAMASGCIVVGFSGLGGSDYMVGMGKSRNCILVENGNYLEIGKSVEKVAEALEKDAHSYDRVIHNAVKISRPFTDLDKEAGDLEAYFKSLQGRPR